MNTSNEVYSINFIPFSFCCHTICNNFYGHIGSQQNGFLFLGCFCRFVSFRFEWTLCHSRILFNNIQFHGNASKLKNLNSMTNICKFIINCIHNGRMVRTSIVVYIYFNGLNQIHSKQSHCTKYGCVCEYFFVLILRRCYCCCLWLLLFCL